MGQNYGSPAMCEYELCSVIFVANISKAMTSLSPQTTHDMSTVSGQSPGGSITSYSTETLRTPKASTTSLKPLPPTPGPETPEVPPIPLYVDQTPRSQVMSPREMSEQTPASDTPMTAPTPAPGMDDDMTHEGNDDEPAVPVNHLSEEGGELTMLTSSLLDCLITVACDAQKIAEVNEEGCFWLILVSRHLRAIQSQGDPNNASTVILEALFKYKQANVFFPQAKMSTMSVLSEVAPTTDVRDLSQQIGWIYQEKIRPEQDKLKRHALKSNWLLARSILGHLYRIRGQYSEAAKFCANALKTIRNIPSAPYSFHIMISEDLQRAYADAGEPQAGRPIKSSLDKMLLEAGTPQQIESARYFYDHSFKLLESATVFAWSGYPDFKDFASLLEGLAGPVHWRTTTLFAYFWIRWRENDTRSRTLNNIATTLTMKPPDIIGAFVTLLYSKMPSDYQFPPVQKLFEDAIKALRGLATDSDIVVPLRKAWFSTFTKNVDLSINIDPSAAAAIGTQVIAMCLCDPDFSSLRELLSSEKYQRMPNAIPTLAMTPRSSISRFRPESVGGSGESVGDRSMRDASSVVDLPSNFMRRSWSSLGSGLLLGQRVSSLRSFYTGKSSRKTRDSRIMERTWDSDDDEADEDIQMLE